jgi:hypothetical protein
LFPQCLFLGPRYIYSQDDGHDARTSFQVDVFELVDQLLAQCEGPVVRALAGKLKTCLAVAASSSGSAFSLQSVRSFVIGGILSVGTYGIFRALKWLYRLCVRCFAPSLFQVYNWLDLFSSLCVAIVS